MLRLWVLLSAFCPAAARSSTKYLILTNARAGSIHYAKVPTLVFTTIPDATLLVGEGLQHPQGAAVDHKYQQLLVADSGLRQVLAYDLSVQDGNLVAGNKKVYADGVETRWVAVDEDGNIYFTDESQNRVMHITQEQIRAGDRRAQVLYAANGTEGVITPRVSAPAGISVEGDTLFWTNKLDGLEVGSVIQAPASPSGRRDPTKIRMRKDDKVYALCAAAGNLFISHNTLNLFAIKTTNEDPAVLISSDFVNPRGCAFDDDTTVYVADRSAGAVFRVPGSMERLKHQLPARVMSFPDAFGIAIYHTESFPWWAVGVAAAATPVVGAGAYGLYRWRASE